MTDCGKCTQYKIAHEEYIVAAKRIIKELEDKDIMMHKHLRNLLVANTVASRKEARKFLERTRK